METINTDVKNIKLKKVHFSDKKLKSQHSISAKQDKLEKEYRETMSAILDAFKEIVLLSLAEFERTGR